MIECARLQNSRSAGATGAVCSTLPSASLTSTVSSAYTSGESGLIHARMVGSLGHHQYAQVDQIQVGDCAWEVDVSPDGTRVYVTDLCAGVGGDNQITEWVIDTATKNVIKIPFTFKGPGF